MSGLKGRLVSVFPPWLNSSHACMSVIGRYYANVQVVTHIKAFGALSSHSFFIFRCGVLCRLPGRHCLCLNITHSHSSWFAQEPVKSVKGQLKTTQAGWDPAVQRIYCRIHRLRRLLSPYRHQTGFLHARTKDNLSL